MAVRLLFVSLIAFSAMTSLARVGIRPLYHKSGYVTERILPFQVLNDDQPATIESADLIGGNNCMVKVDPHRSFLFLIYCDAPATVTVEFRISEASGKFTYKNVRVLKSDAESSPNNNTNSNSTLISDNQDSGQLTSPTDDDSLDSLPDPTATPSSDDDPPPVNTARTGQSIFISYCANCHDSDGSDARLVNKDRADVVASFESVSIMRNQNFSQQFSDQEVTNLANFIGGF